MAAMETLPVRSAAWAGHRAGIQIALRMQSEGTVPKDANFAAFLKRLDLAAWDDLLQVRAVFREFGIKQEIGDSWVYVIHPDQCGVVWNVMPPISDVIRIVVSSVPSNQLAFGPQFDPRDTQSVEDVRQNLLRLLVDVAKESPWHARRE